MGAAPILTAATEFPILWLIPVFPLLGAAINGLAGAWLMNKFGPKANHTIAIIAPSLSFVVGVWAFLKMMSLPENARALVFNAFPFIHVGMFDADMAFWLDPLSATLLLIITFVGTLIHIYSVGYMKGDPSYWRFFCYLNLFMCAMLMLVLGDNFLVMFIGWEGVGLCSYLLISFWYKEKANGVAGMKAFIVNRVGDFAFILALGFLFWGMQGEFKASSASAGLGGVGYHNTRIVSGATGPGGKTVGQTIEADLLARQAQGIYKNTRTNPSTLRFDGVRAIVTANESFWRENSPQAKTVLGIPLVIVICLLLFIAATGKSAQIPLYVWLPDAMAGPTPVSALIHAATMVTAGVYMVARMGFLFSLTPTAMTVVAVVGALTAVFAATVGLFQYDIKKVLAYSTVSQLGYMFIGVGVGAYWAGIYHLLTHALFKACLFLGSGSVILGCHHEQDMRKMGGLAKFMPSTARTYFIACLMITTAPFFFIANGFYSKDEILWKAFDAGHLLIPGWTLWVVGIIGAIFTSFYMWRSYYMTFTGEYRGGHDDAHGDAHEAHDDHGHGGDPHESPKSMTYVLWTLAGLAFLSIGLGFWPLLGHLLHVDWMLEPVFEHFLHPVVGSAMESLNWLSADATNTVAGMSMTFWELSLAIASVALTLGSWYAARVLYKDAKSTFPAQLLDSQSAWVTGTHRLVFNKYYVDEIYDALIVRQTRTLSRFLYAFDKQVIDRMVDGAATVGRVIGTIDGIFDTLVVDGAVNFFAQTVIATGRRLRQTQTGRIQTYLAGAVGGVLVLVFINFFVFMFM